MKKGDHAKITVSINAASQFRSAVLGLKFDPAKAAVRSVSFGDVFGTTLANTAALPFLNENGKMYVSLSMPSGVALDERHTCSCRDRSSCRRRSGDSFGKGRFEFFDRRWKKFRGEILVRNRNGK